MNLKSSYLNLDAQSDLEETNDEQDLDSVTELGTAELETIVAFNPPNRGAPRTTAGAGSR